MQCTQDLNMFKRSTVIISIIFGSGSRAPTTSKMDLFWVIVNGCVNGLKHSIFLKIYIYIYCFSLYKENFF